MAEVENLQRDYRESAIRRGFESARRSGITQEQAGMAERYAYYGIVVAHAQLLGTLFPPPSENAPFLGTEAARVYASRQQDIELARESLKLAGKPFLLFALQKVRNYLTEDGIEVDYDDRNAYTTTYALTELKTSLESGTIPLSDEERREDIQVSLRFLNALENKLNEVNFDLLDQL